jgi:monothiol glutaredoxin
MKGTPEVPMCGFSRAAVQVLNLHGVSADKMKTYNVLEDEELRSGIKEFSYVHFAQGFHLDGVKPVFC